MPLPKRKKGESKQEHASRTIRKLMGDEGYDRKQAIAIGMNHAGLSPKGKKKK